MIKLTVCFTSETEEIKDPFHNTHWYKWREKEEYFNPDYIINFKACNHTTKDLQQMCLNDENFNTVMFVNGFKDIIRIKETPKQIVKLIKGEQIWKKDALDVK